MWQNLQEVCYRGQSEQKVISQGVSKNSSYTAGSARGQYEANPVFLLAIRASIMGPTCPLVSPAIAWSRTRKDYVEWTYKVRNFWTMSAMESQKAEEDS